MKTRIAVLFIVALGAIGVLAGTASAASARSTNDGAIQCSYTYTKGAASFTCHNAAGQTLSCSATWTWWPFGYTITCTLPDGTTKSVHWP
jgi:hypothetical protein